MSEFAWVDVISTVGFPIAITIYLLITRDKTIKELTKAIHDLHITMKSIGDRIK